MNIFARIPKREEILKFLNSRKIHLIILTLLVTSLIAISFTVRSINALASAVNDFVSTADFGVASNASRNPSESLGYFDVLDDESDSTYVNSSSSTATSGSFGVSYSCPLTCPTGVVTSVNVKLRNARHSNAGSNARFGIELRRTDGSILGSVTGIPFSAIAPTIGANETVIAVDPNLNVSASELVTVISWSKASSSGSQVRFLRARLDVTTSDTITPTPSDTPTISPTPTTILTPTPTLTVTPPPLGSKMPLIDMGVQTYFGFTGGLYPNASNTMSVGHSNQGLVSGSKVQPLDTNGNPSPTGKIVLLSVGMSNTRNEWCKYSDTATTCTAESFTGQASVDTRVNKQSLLIVNGARGGQVAIEWTSSTSTNYSKIRTSLTALGASEKQVQVVWIKQANKNPTKKLPASDADAYTLETHIGNIIRTLRVRYPNLQQVFISSRIYAGYATSTLNPEPYAYESGFAVKWLIEAQINQMTNGTIDPRAGNLDYNTNVAPWIAWGPYLWADDNNPRSDGMVWVKGDYASDFTHPAKTGVTKVGSALLNFFLASPQTSSWFLAP